MLFSFSVHVFKAEIPVTIVVDIIAVEVDEGWFSFEHAVR